MDNSWDWVQEELKKIQDEIPQDPEMMQVVDAISVADFWKRRYDEEQMLWERKLTMKEDEKKALQDQAQTHEMAIKELDWKLKELEHRWEQEKLLLEDRLKTKEIEAALDKSKIQWETRLKVLEQENKTLKMELGQAEGIDVVPGLRKTELSEDTFREKEEALRKAKEEVKERLEKLEKEKEEVAISLKEKEGVLSSEREKWKKLEEEVKLMSSQMENRLKGLKEREQEHFIILEDLARGFAHRVRNYLGIMSGTIQLCISNYKMEGELEEQLTIVDQNVQDMLGSIEDFLKFARIPEMSMKKLDMNQTIEENLSTFDNKFKIQNISVTKQFDPKLPLFEGDKSLINEVFQNLLQNSLEAMPQGGQLTISNQYDKTRELISIKITDSGSGISEAHIKKIFQPYFSTKKGRRGLSLTSAKRIINLHRGILAIESTKGKGTTATINFFLEQTNTDASSEEVKK
ncbi:MAG: hypothetical protein JW871_00300 [Endomicrobiales bacterium]|nr:hypothetical protein [Endomicrobiales bacterium]